MPPRRPIAVSLVLGLAGVHVLAACGSRTGLLVDTTFLASSPVDAGVGGGVSDAPSGTEMDGSTSRGGGPGGPLPPIGPPDAPAPDAAGLVPIGCPADAGPAPIYVLTQTNHMYAFQPPPAIGPLPQSGLFAEIGALDCLTDGIASASSMAIARNGIADVLFSDGELFQVDTTEFPTLTMGGPAGTIPCRVTERVPGQAGLLTFGMAFVGGAMGETLFAVPSTASELYTMDTQTLDLSALGPLGPVGVASASLTGTADGRLFAFFGSGPGSAILQVDPSRVDETAYSVFANLPLGSASAIAFWGGSLYLFTAPAYLTSSQVTQFDPTNGSLATQPTFVDDIIVGAGVSSCAPTQ